MTTPRQVQDAFEAVLALYWQHPVVRARNAAWSAALGPRPPVTPARLRKSRLEAAYRRLEPIEGQAKELAARALPDHPLSEVILWQCYPTCRLDGHVPLDEALTELAKLAVKLSKPVDVRLLRIGS
jgi:hypothetical protein